jgi:DNA-binding protein
MSEEQEHKEEEAEETKEEAEEVKEEAITEEAPAEAVSEEKVEEKEVKAVKAPPRAGREQNVIFVGNKPPMNYVMAVVTAFSVPNTDAVVLKARGRAIVTAVDVAEITRTRFFKDAQVNSIAIGTEQITPKEGGNPRNVSIIEISLRK